MSKPIITDHPLIQHKVTLIRDKNTPSKEFRELVSEIAMLMCYEATRDLPLKEIEIETPMTVTKSKVISGRKLAFVPILRAGLGMCDGMLALVPAAKSGTSVCTAIRKPILPMSTIASCPPTSRSGTSFCSIRCSPPAARPSTR